MAVKSGTECGSFTSGAGRTDAVIAGFDVDYLGGGRDGSVVGCRYYNATFAFPDNDFTADFFLSAWTVAMATARSLLCPSSAGVGD